MTIEEFINQKEDVLVVVGAILEAEGATKELEIVRNCESKLVYGATMDANYYWLSFKVVYPEYKRLKKHMKQLEWKLKDVVSIIANDKEHKLGLVKFIPTIANVDAKESKGAITLPINNQGRVRSDNPAIIQMDGLYFRSQPEIHLYRALKTLGFVFAPLPVFLKGGKTYERYEPDFFIIKNGQMMIVEIDGQVIHSQRALYDRKRSMTFEREGVIVIRLKANDCFTEEGAMYEAKKIQSKVNTVS